MRDSANSPQALTSTNKQGSQSFFSPRSIRQLTLVGAGAGFVLLTSFITRRALVRRYKQSIPKFYNQSHGGKGNEVNGALEALDAFTIATINVTSISIYLVGAGLWAFDVSSLQEMRGRIRRRMGLDQQRQNTTIEDEIEEWFASVMREKKDNKDVQSVENVSLILGKVAEKERLAKEAKERGDQS
ncbi:hypothetical protein BJ878DRAFT_51297 [Calycina marina]|uniref:Altered inheritance of mitochondria protein 11 n=1 Tax=Calycina marina TaxID=1763456 RepID=A0A9P7Z3A9_9HELO|nr:hypothetical protein BJ878DRAFT_51297 [Calycina marina]